MWQDFLLTRFTVLCKHLSVYKKNRRFHNTSWERFPTCLWNGGLRTTLSYSLWRTRKHKRRLLGAKESQKKSYVVHLTRSNITVSTFFLFFSHWLASKFSQAHLKLPRFQTSRPPNQPYLWPVACTIIFIITIIDTIIIILSSSSQHQNYDYHQHHLRQHHRIASYLK